jgi:hypothetical protein
MAVGSWRNGGAVRPQRKRKTPRSPPPGFPILTGMSEEQHEAFAKQVGAIETLAGEALNGMSPEQRKNVESSMDAQEKARASSGQVAKVD